MDIHGDDVCHVDACGYDGADCVGGELRMFPFAKQYGRLLSELFAAAYRNERYQINDGYWYNIETY